MGKSIISNPFCTPSYYRREGAATLFLGVGRGGLEELDFGQFRFYPPAKLVDSPDLEDEIGDPNLLKATLGMYGYSKDKRTFVGRRLTFNRVLHFDSYASFHWVIHLPDNTLISSFVQK